MRKLFSSTNIRGLLAWMIKLGTLGEAFCFMDDFNLIVYFLKNPKTGLVKIGKAKDFDARYKTLCREAGCDLEVLLIVFAEDTERQLHHYFSETRAYKNEWFEEDERLLILIEESKSEGHLIYPEGTPYRELPVDYRREVEQQRNKINSLNNSLQQVRQKRDEYKKLSSSAVYYKTLVVKDRKRKDQEYLRRLKTAFIFIFLYALIFYCAINYNSTYIAKAHLISQCLASLFMFRWTSMKIGIKSIDITTTIFCGLFLVGFIGSLLSLLIVYFTS